jgi:hypothetical protein
MNIVWFVSFLALAYLASPAAAQELPADATQALAEYAAKRADVMRKADAELAKHKQTLLKKMQKSLQAAAGKPEAAKQVEDLIAKINAAGFTSFDIEEVLKANASTVTAEIAYQLQRAYATDQMTEEQWQALPAIAIEVECGTFVATGIEAAPGQSFIICPNPKQKWKIGISGWTDYRGGSLKADYLIAKAKVEQTTKPNQSSLKNSILFTAEQTGPLKVGTSVPAGQGPQGTICFKVFRVQAH